MFRRLFVLISVVGLGANPWERLRMFWTYFATRRGKSTVVRVLVHGKVFPITISSPADRTVLREVFVDGEYNNVCQPSPSIIVDVGANIGMASLYFASRFPECVIHAIEPCPKTFECLVENTAAFPNIKVHNVAISSKGGIADFYVSEAHFGSSLIARGNPNEKKISVITLTMDEFMDAQSLERVGLLKFDLEGYEAEMMRGLTVCRIEQFIGELHFDLMPEKIDYFKDRLQGRLVTLFPISINRSIIHAR